MLVHKIACQNIASHECLNKLLLGKISWKSVIKQIDCLYEKHSNAFGDEIFREKRLKYFKILQIFVI